MPEHAPAPTAHGVVVLAAGASKRLGQPKQLIEIDGETLLHRAVRFAAASEPGDLVVVLSADAEAMREAIRDLGCRIVICDEAASGMSASLRHGLAQLDPICAGALIVLVDQPDLDAEHLCALRDGWREAPHQAMASRYADTFGVPAILPRGWFVDLINGAADHGARDLLRARQPQVRTIDAPQLALDLDSACDLARWKSGSV